MSTPVRIGMVVLGEPGPGWHHDKTPENEREMFANWRDSAANLHTRANVLQQSG